MVLTSERGQSTVEFALLLPVMALVFMLLIQVGVIVRDSILVSSATREAARVLAVENNHDKALSKARESIDGISLEINRPDGVGSTLKVTGSKKISIHFLFIPKSIDFSLKEKISMRVEK